MSINRKGNLILFTGSSGVGKGTIIKELLDRDKNIRLSVSNTTREPREGEIDGVHYNFLTREQFNDVLKKDGYLEHAEFCGNLYGTPKKQVEDMLNKGYDVLLEIEVKGGLQILDKYPDILSIFILPPSMSLLKDGFAEEVQRMKKLFGKGLHRLPRKSATRTDISTMW